jgi:predicted lipoprotein with Yx(FWY)xxD motif
MRIAPLVLIPATLALAGCGASDLATVATSRLASKHAVVKTRHGRLGTFLVDGSGRTLYLFRRDTGRRSHCYGACAQNWPALITRERPEAEGRARAALLSTSRRTGGARQVVYNGHPLYRFVADAAPGDTNGEGLNEFGGRWYVVSPAGRAITRAPASATPTPTPTPYMY